MEAIGILRAVPFAVLPCAKDPERSVRFVEPGRGGETSGLEDPIANLRMDPPGPFWHLQCRTQHRTSEGMWIPALETRGSRLLGDMDMDMEQGRY